MKLDSRQLAGSDRKWLLCIPNSQHESRMIDVTLGDCGKAPVRVEGTVRLSDDLSTHYIKLAAVPERYFCWWEPQSMSTLGEWVHHSPEPGLSMTNPHFMPEFAMRLSQAREIEKRYRSYTRGKLVILQETRDEEGEA
jgi:hypothetical protein